MLRRVELKVGADSIGDHARLLEIRVPDGQVPVGDQRQDPVTSRGADRQQVDVHDVLPEALHQVLQAADAPNRAVTLRALEDALLEFAGSVMVISHDRWFLDRIATHILAAEGDSQWTFFDGNYQEYEADKKKRLGEEGAKPKRMRYKALK